MTQKVLKINIRPSYNSGNTVFENIGQNIVTQCLLPSLFLGNNADAQKFLSRPAQVIIRMRGLPYDATSKQVVRKIFYLFIFLEIVTRGRSQIMLCIFHCFFTTHPPMVMFLQ